MNEWDKLALFIYNYIGGGLFIVLVLLILILGGLWLNILTSDISKKGKILTYILSILSLMIIGVLIWSDKVVFEEKPIGYFGQNEPAVKMSILDYHKESEYKSEMESRISDLEKLKGSIRWNDDYKKALIHVIKSKTYTSRLPDTYLGYGFPNTDEINVGGGSRHDKYELEMIKKDGSYLRWSGDKPTYILKYDEKLLKRLENLK